MLTGEVYHKQKMDAIIQAETFFVSACIVEIVLELFTSQSPGLKRFAMVLHWFPKGDDGYNYSA